jgi:rod shape-determining protein MreC
VARAARFSSRIDLAAFGLFIILSLVAAAAPATMREPVAQALRRSVVVPLVGLQRGAERWRAAWLASENDTRKTDSLALQAFAVPVLQSENQRLRRLLGLGSRLDWGFVPAEALHVASRAERFTLTLTAGSNAGIDEGSPVVAPEGIVGVVISADPTVSVAMTFAHPDFRVSAMTADGSAFGIVSARLTGDPEAPERYLLQLRGVPIRNTVKPNTLVYSSGLGGRFPRGIPIGTVVQEIKTPETWARTYVVRPAVNLAEASAVMVLYPKRAAEGVESVWAMGTATDSAIRAVAAAGDSMARSDSAGVVAARRRALDSLARVEAPDTARAAPARQQPAPSAPATATPVTRPPATRPPPRAGATTAPTVPTVPTAPSASPAAPPPAPRPR